MTLSENNYKNEQADSTSSQENQIDIDDESKYQQSPLPEDIKTITLLEEKLHINRSKQKVGEVIVRKQIETRMIQVPIQREKLIIERIGQNPEKLTEVIIKEEKVNGFAHQELENTDILHITKSNYLNLQMAQELLESISYLASAKNTKIRLEIISTCSEDQIEHQNICDRYQ